jgi:HAD superfamily phosphatase (TIGR01668 family)
MFEKYFPEKYVEKIQDISLEELKRKNIKGLLIDIDNTLVPSRVKEANENIVKWLQRVKENGFKVCIFSNASKKRVIKFNDKLKLPAVYRAAKPWKRAYKKAIDLLGLKPCEMAMIGDQIFTDHMFVMDYSEDKGWFDPRIVPYAPLVLDPSAMIFH